MAALVGSQAVEHGLIGGALHFRIQRGVDTQPAFVNFVAAVFLFQIAADFFGKVGRQRIGITLQVQDDGGGFGAGGFGGGDFAVLQHGVQDQVAAGGGALHVHQGRIVVGSLGKSGQQGGFVQSQVAGMLAEVELGPGLEAIDAVSQEYLVGVQREDLRLGKAALDLDGEHDLFDFAAEGALLGEKQIARKLHGDGGSALGAASGTEIAIGGSQHAPEVNPPVTVEVLVLGGEHGITQDFGEIVVRIDDAALQGEGCDHVSLVVVEFGDGAGTEGLELAHLGQVGGVDDEHAREGPHQDGRQQHEGKGDPPHQPAPADADGRYPVIKR